MTDLNQYEMSLLRDLMLGKRVSGSDRNDDRARQRCKRLGFVTFDNGIREWAITDAGKEAYRDGVVRLAELVSAAPNVCTGAAS